MANVLIPVSIPTALFFDIGFCFTFISAISTVMLMKNLLVGVFSIVDVLITPSNSLLILVFTHPNLGSDTLLASKSTFVFCGKPT